MEARFHTEYSKQLEAVASPQMTNELASRLQPHLLRKHASGTTCASMVDQAKEIDPYIDKR